jgi:NAD(P)-dependent dehydrogenase (short-subunit alcohol dehydrogenase family)
MSVLDTFNLKGKVALLTGGAGLYGRQIAEALAEAGATTIMASRNIEALEAQAKAFRARGLDIFARQLDQSDETSITNLVSSAINEFKGVDILVNNAVLRPMKNWEDPAESFGRSMEVNATGIFMMTRAFGDHMAERRCGSIINVGSIQGMVGPDLTLYDDLYNSVPPDYYFHKGGMINFTRYAASHYGAKNVRVNIISPGGFNPELPESFVKRYSARTFLGRMANERDLKGVVVFLASEASSYITGANIAVDGGYTAK